jgi:hypothetical protein
LRKPANPGLLLNHGFLKIPFFPRIPGFPGDDDEDIPFSPQHILTRTTSVPVSREEKPGQRNAGGRENGTTISQINL